MVLTQQTMPRRLSYTRRVSIPLWFLRNFDEKVEKAILEMLFPYHYGSYATSIQAEDAARGIRFPYHYGSYATIHSIAVLFSLSIKFPYHYGSYATPVSLRARQRIRWVSIPLWFLRNRAVEGKYCFGDLRFHTTMVLTQRMNTAFHTNTTSRFHTTMVLTQQG